MMRASKLEFRIRYWVHTVVYVIGFTSPWMYLHRSSELRLEGANAHVWGVLSAYLAQWMGGTAGPGDILTAFNIVLAVGTVFAILGAGLRTWGAAYLGAAVVQSGTMHAEGSGETGPQGILEDGPFRYVRNPLYLGTILHTLALTMLMPRSGAVFTLVAIFILQLRLIGGEERFLTQHLGNVYLAYCKRVPRLLPALRPRVAGTGLQPHWGQAFLAEIYMWGVAGSFAFAGWRYNAMLLTECVIVSFGVSLIVKALVGARQVAA